MGLISRVSSRTYRPKKNLTMSFVNPEDFQHILRVQNTNIDGNIKVTNAVTAIRGMGRRFTDLVLKKAEVDRSKRAGQLTEAELEQIQTVMTQPKNFKIPVWFLNRRRDWKDGKDGQMTSNNLDNKLREDLERMKKIRLHRGIRHWWGVPVKGQKTKTSGRHGRTVGVRPERSKLFNNIQVSSLIAHCAELAS